MGCCQSLCRERYEFQFIDVQLHLSEDNLTRDIEPEEKIYYDLKEDLINYYRENESHIPASPLVDEHNVPIEELYVLPTMFAYEEPYNFGPGRTTPKANETSEIDEKCKQNIALSELFFCGDVRYRKIYITANAGCGKTSLSQKLTMTWCQSHLPLTALKEKYEYKEIDTMNYFDLLFLLHLRDYQSDPKCNLDDLILKMLSANMSRKSQYDRCFLERILHEKKCLIILDGLDEWSHPAHCPRKPEVPHNDHPDSCTVLTTTRDWKIGTIGLSPNYIDRRVEISILDRKTRKLLEKNAIEILNKRNLNLAGNTIEDFDEEVETVEIGDIIYIPYILLQLMCLFFGGLPIGKSKCEMYSNITEFTLTRGLYKRKLPDIHVQSNDNALVPNIMKENENCKLYFVLLMKLGKLAFYTLFSKKIESSLVFERIIVMKYMTEQEIEFCLKVGLLCQTKDSRIYAVKRYYVFFQHKSVQEFFCAIYITTEWRNESVKSTVLNVCSSLSGILEMSNLFVFVCGINPKVYTCISDELQEIVDLDGVTRRCSISGCFDDDARTIHSYQMMQMNCLQESMRNDNARCFIILHFVLGNYMNNTLDSINYMDMNHSVDLTALISIIRFNKCSIKSLQLSNSDRITAFMQSQDPGVFSFLEKLRVEQTSCKEIIWLASILTDSVRSLKWLTLSLGLMPLSNIVIKALTGLTCLHSLELDHVHMTHSSLKSFYDYISQTTTLTRLKMGYIHCLDHRWGTNVICDATLDLHGLHKLERVTLDLIGMTSAAWKTLLLSVGFLPFPVTVKLSFCRGPSQDEWQTIVNVIKSTPTLSLIHDLSFDSGGYAYLAYLALNKTID